MAGSARITIDSIELPAPGKLPIVRGFFEDIPAVDVPIAVRFTTLTWNSELLKVFQCYVDWDKVRYDTSHTGGGFESDAADWDFSEIQQDEAHHLQISVYLAGRDGPSAVCTGHIQIYELLTKTGPLPLTKGHLYEDDFTVPD